LVDDDIDFTEALSLRLKMHNYHVTIVHKGREVFDKISPDTNMILLDITLPDINGYKICQMLRENKRTHRIPIIMITGKDAPKEKIEGLYIGADDYVTKPLEAEELLARMDAVLRRTEYFYALERDNARAIEEINRIIENKLIIPRFQPIFNMDPRKLIGLEMLSRCSISNSYFGNTEMLFDTAFQVGLLYDLEIACHRQALSVLKGRMQDTTLFFNVSPYLIRDPKMRNFSYFAEYNIKPENVVLEITERTAIADIDEFCGNIAAIKKLGFKISIDDVGSGYSSLDSVVKIKPHFVKIGLNLVRNIHIDPVRQNICSAIVMMCKKSDIVTIAEGVEEQGELEAMREMGTDACQGFLLGRPSADIRDFV